MKFQVARAGRITAIRYWKSPSDGGSHVGRIWSSTGTLLASVTFSGGTASGWQQQGLPTPLSIQPNTTYVVSVNINTNYPFTNGGLANAIVNGDIRSVSGTNGVYGNRSAFPSTSFQNSNYFRDIVFVPDTGSGPARLVLTPATTTTLSGTAVSYTATIQDAAGNTVTTATNAISFSVSGVSGSFNPASPVAASAGIATSSFTPTTTGTATITASAAGLTSATATLTVTPGAPAKLALAPASGSTQVGTAVNYTATIQDANGNTVTTANNPVTFAVTGITGSFSPASPVTPTGGTATSSVTPSTAGTGTVTASAAGLTSASATLTVASVAGPPAKLTLTPATSTTRVGTAVTYTATIQDANGVTVSSASNPITFASAGVAGSFTPPSPVNAVNGVATANFSPSMIGDATISVAAAGLTGAAASLTVTASPGVPAKLALTPVDATGAVGTALRYTATIQDINGATVNSATNPITFTVAGVAGSFDPPSPVTAVAGVAVSDLTPAAAGTGTVTASANGLVSATVGLTVAATGQPAKLSLVPANASTQVGSQVVYNATIQDANGQTVTTATNAVTFSATGVSGAFAPSSPVAAAGGIATANFTPTTAGTATITGSSNGLTGDTAILTVTAAPGNQSQTLFTTQTPASPNLSDGVPYELGMKFRVARVGKINAIRYWKSPSDSGTHVGRIWSSSGTQLASVTFTNETASGWQQQALPTPVSVQPNTTYVVSVSISSNYPFTLGGLANSIVNGDLSSVADGSNGVYGSPFAFPTNAYQNSNYFRDVVYTPDSISTIAKASGDNQSGAPNALLPDPLVVLVRDDNNNPLPNVPVSFTVTSGNGSVTPANAITNGSGQASATMRLGSFGPTMVTASAAGIGSATFRAVVVNAVYLENQLPGTTAWRITNPVSAANPEIAGYASATSVNKGGTLPFKITLAQPGQYTINVYRLGYYGGTGGRSMGSFGPFNGVTQPACTITQPATRLIECQWSTSFTLSVGANWTSGLYIANLTATASGRQSQIWFVVRDDTSTADLVFQASLMNHLAYNNYGDGQRHSLYEYNSTNGQRAFKVSFDRPFGAVTVDPTNANSMVRYERNMARWLESQGYDVKYISNVDVHTNPELLLNHKGFLSVGHDEYWSLEMRNGVEAARDAGVHLGFFSANTAYWRVRMEPSSTGEPNRVMVCYKDPGANDPVAPTYLWRGPENNRPENSLLGIMYVGDNTVVDGFDYVVSNANDPYYNNTGLTNGASISGIVGFEWDAAVSNGRTPAGLVVLGTSPTTPTVIAPGLPPGTSASMSHAARYTAPSGAKVFSTGSIQFAWGLDSDGVFPPRADSRIRQFVINILADFGARPLIPSDGMIVP
jgi:hypothetical protein